MTKSMVGAYALILEFTSPALSPLEGLTGVLLWIFCSLCATVIVAQIWAALNALLSPQRIDCAFKREQRAKVLA